MSRKSDVCRLKRQVVASEDFAVKLTALCVLRGVKAEVTYGGDPAVYRVDGAFCGPSVHDVMAWIEKQVAAKVAQP